MKKKILFALALVCALVLAFGVVNASAASSGTCGTSLTWVLDDSGTLTISGSGKMSYYSPSPPPWEDSKSLIKKVVIEDGVTSIADNAFDGCVNLAEAEIAQSVNSIGKSAFYECSSLTSLTIPTGVTAIASDTFFSCTSLESIEIPEGVVSIADEAFFFCRALENVKIPSTVTSIGKGAFCHCINLKDVYISDIEAWCRIKFVNAYSNPLNYEAKLYLGDNLVEELKIPAGISSVNFRAFWGCSSIKNVTIPYSVTRIGGGAFSYCANLESVNIGENVAVIDRDAFSGCGKLTSIDVNENNKSYASVDGNLFDIEKTTLVQYSAGKPEKDYTLPETVTNIDYGAFAYSRNLSGVSVSNNVANVGEYAFYWCDGLDDVYYFGTQEEWNGIAVGENNEPLINATKRLYADEMITVTSVSGDGKTFDVWVSPLLEGKYIIVALYSDKALVDLQSAVYASGELEFTTETDYDTAKVMVRDTLGSLVPVTKAEEVK